MNSPNDQRYVQTEPPIIEIEGPEICAHFGCARPLTLIEQLAGKVCTNHMTNISIDPSDFVRFL